MKNFIVPILILLVSCDRDPKDVGKVLESYDWKCFKSESRVAPNISMSGKIGMTMVTTCVVTRCYYRKYRLEKSMFEQTTLDHKIVDDNYCI